MQLQATLAIRALEKMRGDDLQRARNAFSGLTPAQLAQQHGMSGRTRAEVLAEYERHDAQITEAIAWVNSIK